MSALHRIAEQRLVDLTAETARLAVARFAQPNGPDANLAELILAAAEDRVARDFPADWQLSQKIAEKLDRPALPGTLYVERAPLTAAGNGANLIGKTIPGIYGETGRDTDLLDVLGVERVPMVDNGGFAKVTTPNTGGWLSNETTNANSSDVVLGTTAVTPKRAGGVFEISSQLLKQSSQAAAALVVRELTRTVQHAVVAGVLNGSGSSGQPTGIVGTTGVGNQSGTTLAWAGIIEMMRMVEAVGSLNPNSAAFVMDPAVGKLLRTRERASGSGLILNDDKIGPYKAYVSSAMPAGSILFGDWSQVVVPTWGVLEIGANPYAAGNFRAGVVMVRCFAAVDVAVLRPASFARAVSVT